MFPLDKTRRSFTFHQIFVLDLDLDLFYFIYYVRKLNLNQDNYDIGREKSRIVLRMILNGNITIDFLQINENKIK